MKKILALTLFFSGLLSGCGVAQKQAPFNGAEAWQELVQALRQHYAYLHRSDLDTDALFQEFGARAAKATTPQMFADISQQFLRHFIDPHLNLGPYNSEDYSVYPTGSDIYAEFVPTSQAENTNKSDTLKLMVLDVKAGSAADIAGIRPGQEVLTIDGLSVKHAVEKVFGEHFGQLTAAQANYGANISLGGFRNQPRQLTLRRDQHQQALTLAASYDAINTLKDGATVTVRQFGEVGYIRFNNSLGNNETPDAFKAALNQLPESTSLIIDLRNTPSGGNTGVAEPILGHFAQAKSPYQRYQVQQKGTPYSQATMQTAYTTPTAPAYPHPFVVLAGHWTGSMGEGMTIGLDALGAKAVVGTPMAKLLGGIKTIQLTKSQTWLEVGFERLYHINGIFREDYRPTILTQSADRDPQGNDPALTAAINILMASGTLSTSALHSEMH